MKLVYLHVPHTCGRLIKRDLWGKNLLKNVVCVHNQNDIIKQCSFVELVDLKDTCKNPYQLYFVLREPLERIIGEYKHYSKTLTYDMEVNHLEPNDVKHIDLNNILDYYSLEVNRNTYCKFILLKTNFNQPINDNDYQNIIKIIDSGKIKYDMYSFPLSSLPILSDIVGKDILPVSTFSNVKKNEILSNNDICNKLRKINIYDFMLYEHLCKKVITFPLIPQ